MAEIWEQNEEINEDEELVVTDHRDAREPTVLPEDEQSIEVTTDDPREVLEEQGEDVSSSPARRGHNNKIDTQTEDAGLANDSQIENAELDITETGVTELDESELNEVEK